MATLNPVAPVVSAAPAAKTVPNVPAVTLCTLCGKPITRDSSVAKGMGHLCDDHIAAGWTRDKMLKHRQGISTTTEPAPDKFVKLAAVSRKCRELGIPVSRLVKAVGGDRSLVAPKSADFKVVYFGNVRYLPVSVLSAIKELK